MPSKKRIRRKMQNNTVSKRDRKNNLHIPSLLLFGIVFVVINLYFTYFREIDDSELDVVTVYKAPTCDCCNKWIEHLRDNNFKVRSVNAVNMGKIKRDKGVPVKLNSCHTAVINGYVIEGHVPSSDIRKLLTEKRDVIGLSVPKMPLGSPGMESITVEPYDVYEFDRQGNQKVINHY